MDSIDVTTTRSKLADAMNRVVAMTEYETDEMIDAVLGVEDEADEDQPEPLELHEISDRLDDRLRWALGTLDMIVCEQDARNPIADGASGAAHY